MPPYLLNFHYQLLDYINSHKFISGNDLKAVFPDRQSRFPECLLYLFDNQIIHATPAADEEAYYSGKSIENDLPKHFHMDYHLLITDYGYFLMEQHQEHVTEMNTMQEQLNSSKNSADIANKIAIAAACISLSSIFISALVSILTSKLPYLILPLLNSLLKLLQSSS